MTGIVPIPKKVTEKEGYFDLAGVTVRVDDGADRRVVAAASTLCREISEATSTHIALTTRKEEREIYLSVTGEGEAYTLSIGDGVTATGGAAGVFYAIQSLRQLVKIYGAKIPKCEIEDAPDFPYRGFYHDITRGRVGKLEKLKRLADTLSYFKINSLQLYVEDAFTFRELDGIVTADEALTPGEIIELDEYCRDRFIDLVPSLSTFGHLFTLLQSEKYCHISELGHHEMTMNYWMEKQWHHTVDVFAPETIEVIGSMIDQYVPLFSSEYFNICCDETMDLCSGKNAGRDKGEAYFYHLDRLIEIVKSHGKRVMMWGDEVMARSELSKEHLPPDTIILNWCYHKTVNEWIPKFFYDLGFTQIVCPGTSSWDNFIEDIDSSAGNISDFARHAKKYGALGMLNTNWGDFGHVCPFNCSLYGTVLGAAKSWNEAFSTNAEYERAVSLLVYGVKNINIADVLRTLGGAAKTCNWSRFVMWHSDNTIGGKHTELSYGENLTEEDAVRNIDICKKEEEALLSLNSASPIISDLILSARALALMNRLVLYVHGKDEYGVSLQADFDAWLEDYSAAWLRDDKPSGLPRLRDFIHNITKTRMGLSQ